MGMQDPMLSMLEWLCGQMMEAEVSSQLGAGKHEQNPDRVSHRCGFRPRRLDTRMGTVYLPVPKVRNGGYIPFFVTERRRSEAALVQVVQEAFMQGVSTRKMEKLAKSLGIEVLKEGREDALTFLSFPSLDSRKVSSNNLLERLNKEIRRRTRVVGIFPNPESYLRLVTVYLTEYSEDWSVTKAYLGEESLRSLTNQAA
jgi:transposase-like protein